MSKASPRMEKMFRKRAIRQWNERISELEEQLIQAKKVRDDLITELEKISTEDDELQN